MIWLCLRPLHKRILAMKIMQQSPVSQDTNRMEAVLLQPKKVPNSKRPQCCHKKARQSQAHSERKQTFPFFV